MNAEEIDGKLMNLDLKCMVSLVRFTKGKTTKN